jgi:hypothetical protein
MSIPTPDRDVLERLLTERRIAGTPTPDEPESPVAAPSDQADSEAEKRRLTSADNRRRVELEAVARRRQEADAIVMRQAEARRAREAFYDENPHWRD